MSQIRYTHLTKDLCQSAAELIPVCFPDMPASDQMSVTSFLRLAELFPEGQILALDGSNVVGFGTGVFLNIEPENLPPTENALLYTDGKTSHELDAHYYYGTDLAVHPDYQGLGIARQIYNRRKALVVDNNKKGFYAAAVIPGFADHRHEMDIHSYIENVVAGQLFDPTVSVQLRNGFHVVRLIHKFFTFPRSDNWAALIYWENESYEG